MSIIKTSSPLVSIMIPTYNQEGYITQTIMSALNQSYKNIEVIVSDDSTNNKTKDLISLIKNDNLRYIKNAPSLGRVKNYHYLLHTLAKGEFVLNLDGDDYLSDEHYIEKAMNLFQKYEDQNIVEITAPYYILKNGILKPNSNNCDEKTKLIKGKDHFLNPYKLKGGHLTSLYKREVALKLNFFNSNIITADSESLLRLSLEGNILFYNKPVAVWRYHSNNTSMHSDTNEYFKSLNRIERLKEFASDYSHVTKEELQQWEKRMYKRGFSDIFRRIYWQKDFKRIAELKQIMKIHDVFFMEILDIGNTRKIISLFIYSIIHKFSIHSPVFNKLKTLLFQIDR